MIVLNASAATDSELAVCQQQVQQLYTARQTGDAAELGRLLGGLGRQ